MEEKKEERKEQFDPGFNSVRLRKKIRMKNEKPIRQIKEENELKMLGRRIEEKKEKEKEEKKRKKSAS